jgi:phosphinothricin acetyltransferase
MSDLRVRPARVADLPAVTAIYNEGIRGRTATFETAERQVADLAMWLESSHPFLVAERAEDGGGEVVGWIRSAPYRPRECYAGIGDFSLYVAAGARRHGVGRELMRAFLPACAAAGLWKVIGRIFPENDASRALCARHGFREVGRYEKHARLDGAWRDVVIVERWLGSSNPSPPAASPSEQRA